MVRWVLVDGVRAERGVENVRLLLRAVLLGGMGFCCSFQGGRGLWDQGLLVWCGTWHSQ